MFHFCCRYPIHLFPLAHWSSLRDVIFPLQEIQHPGFTSLQLNPLQNASSGGMKHGGKAAAEVVKSCPIPNQSCRRCREAKHSWSFEKVVPWATARSRVPETVLHKQTMSGELARSHAMLREHSWNFVVKSCLSITNAVSISAVYQLTLEASTALHNSNSYSGSSAWAPPGYFCGCTQMSSGFCGAGNSSEALTFISFSWCELFCPKCPWDAKSQHVVRYRAAANTQNILGSSKSAFVRLLQNTATAS